MDSSEEFQQQQQQPHRGEGDKPPQHTVLDKSISILVLNVDDSTPSRKDGIASVVEMRHRLHGASILAEAWSLLPQRGRLRISKHHQHKKDGGAEKSSSDGNGDVGVVGDSDKQKNDDATTVASVAEAAACCHATAATIFHRFYHTASLEKFDVWSVAMASSLLASKLDGRFELSINRLILIFSFVYNKRRIWQKMQVEEEEEEEEAGGAATEKVAGEKKRERRRRRQQLLRETSFGFLSPMGPVYKEWRDAVVRTENDILRKLGFTFYWIPNQHVHKFLPMLLNLLFEGEQTDEEHSQRRRLLGQRSWNYANDSYRLDLISRYESHFIACSAVHLACLDCNFYAAAASQAASDDDDNHGNGDIDKIKKRVPWWEHVCCSTDATSAEKSAVAMKISTICNALLGLQQQLAQNKDLQQAVFGFSPSMMRPEGSFNDPESFIWEMMEGASE